MTAVQPFLDYLMKNPVVLAAICSLCGVIVGATLTGFFALYLAKQNRKQQDRQHIRQLAIQLAVEEWKQLDNVKLTMAKVSAEKNERWSISHDPIESAVHRMLCFTEKITNKEPSLLQRLRNRWNKKE